MFVEYLSSVIQKKIFRKIAYQINIVNKSVTLCKIKTKILFKYKNGVKCLGAAVMKFVCSLRCETI